MSSESPQSASRGPLIWTLITGLAVGFAIGNGVGGGGGAKSPESDEKVASAPPPRPTTPSAVAAPAKPGQIFARQSDFPAGWLKEADLAAVAGISFDGLNDKQKTTALQAMNERNCECGCNMGSLATCAKKDPNCPRSPMLVKLAIEKAKAGQSIADVLGAIDARQKELGSAAKPAPEAPKGPKKIELADNSPRLGPRGAKATIVEWSDFQ